MQTERKQLELQRHCANRGLTTGTVLNYLNQRFPAQFEFAKVVGYWIWLDDSSDINPRLRIALWLLGFHLNRKRGVWQHPCGAFMLPAPPTGETRGTSGTRFATSIPA
jgi:hypothetical protein